MGVGMSRVRDWSSFKGKTARPLAGKNAKEKNGNEVGIRQRYFRFTHSNIQRLNKGMMKQKLKGEKKLAQ